jgi:hypothetical protein
MVGGKRRVRRAALQGDRPPAVIHDEPVPAVALQDAADIADIVQQAGDDQVREVLRLQALGEHAAAQDIASGQGDEEGVLDVVVEGVALAQALQRNACDSIEALGLVPVRGAKQPPEVVREMLAEFIRHDRGNRHHGGLPCCAASQPMASLLNPCEVTTARAWGPAIEMHRRLRHPAPRFRAKR